MVFGFKVHDIHDPKGGDNIPTSATATAAADGGVGIEVEVKAVKEDEGDSMCGEVEGRGQVHVKKEEEISKIEKDNVEEAGREVEGTDAVSMCRISVACLKPAESEEQLLQFWS